MLWPRLDLPFRRSLFGKQKGEDETFDMGDVIATSLQYIAAVVKLGKFPLEKKGFSGNRRIRIQS